MDFLRKLFGKRQPAPSGSSDLPKPAITPSNGSRKDELAPEQRAAGVEDARPTGSEDVVFVKDDRKTQNLAGQEQTSGSQPTRRLLRRAARAARALP